VYKGIVDKKGAIEIPKPIRDQIGIKPGSKIAFELDDQNIVMILIPEFPPDKAPLPKEKAPLPKEKTPKGKEKPAKVKGKTPESQEEPDELAKKLSEVADEQSKKKEI